MNPDSENNLPNQNNLPDSQGDSPTPQAEPGGVIKPTNNDNPPPQAEAPASEPASPPSQPPAQPSQNPPLQNNVPQDIPPQPDNAAQNNPSSWQSQPSPRPAQPAGSEIFPSDPVGPASGNIKSGSSKKKLLLIAIPILLVLLIAGYVFGYYIPNRPGNVYKTGLDRSGDALEMIVNRATEQETYDKFKKSEITANVDINSGGQNITGDFTAKFDETKLDTDLNLSFPSDGSGQAEVGLSLLSDKAEDKQFPDTYLNLRGFQSMGADLFLPGIGKYDNRWLEISADYLQSLADQYGIEPKQQDNTEDYPTFDEISSLIRDLYGDTNEYIFTSDPEKAVIENRQYLGKEEVEGVDAYHYEVAINKENSKKYCEALSNTLLSSPAYKKFLGLNDEQIESEKQRIGEDCQNDSDNIKDDDTFEMWVDSKYKLVKKIRIYNGEDKGEYYEFGQNYDGGEKVSLFFASSSDKGGFNSKTTFTTDLNTAESSGEMTFNGGSEGAGAYDGTITLTAKPLSEDFEVTKPDNTVNIEKLLKDIGIDPKGLVSLYGGNPAVDTTSGVNTSANDAKIKTDINVIYSHLEVYFATNSNYPTQAQLNDQSWRAANMQGLSQDVFTTAITYSPSGCNASGCQKFTLSGKLSDGSTFEQTGSNN